MLFSKRTAHALVAGFLLTLVAAPGWAGEAVALQTDAPVLVAGDAWRGESVQPGHSDRLLLQVAEPGVVALAVAAPGRQPLAPELVLDPAPYGPPAAGPAAEIVERTDSSLLVLVRTPGAYRLQVMPRDPLLALGTYRIESRFAASADLSLAGSDRHSVHAADGTGGGGPHDEEDEDIEEVEGEPANSWSPPTESGPCPGGIGGGGSVGTEEAGRLRFLALCRGGATDDHSDLMDCATALEPGEVVAGSLGNAYGDDHDLFTFQLDSPARVQVETVGESDTFGGLYDDRGRRLAVDDDGGVGRNFRLRAVLGPGRYYVRVEGAEGAGGAYRLVLRAPAE